MPTIVNPGVGCGARTKRSGEPCRHGAGMRTDHPGAGRCWLHGGRTPSGKAHADREAAQQQLTKLGIPIQVDPIQALLQEVCEAAGNVAFLRQQVQELDAKSVASSAMVVLYNEERERLAKVAKAAVDAGIADRQVRLAEQQAMTLVHVVRVVLSRLGLPDSRRELAVRYTIEELHVVAANPQLVGAS